MIVVLQVDLNHFPPQVHIYCVQICGIRVMSATASYLEINKITVVSFVPTHLDVIRQLTRYSCDDI